MRGRLFSGVGGCKGECGRCFLEALELGKNIKLGDGGEGVDELWGEPFRVFSMPIDEFFKTRYIKIAQTMSEIDQIADALRKVIDQYTLFDDMEDMLLELAETAKLACETIRTDPVIFDVWPRYIAAKEAYEEHMVNLLVGKKSREYLQYLDAYQLIKYGGALLIKLATLRVPIPNSVRDFSQRCNEFVNQQ